MSMVKLQIRKLRECAWKYSHGEYVSKSAVGKILNEAADTIESLTAKLQAANMERSADCGGWIPCSERMPDTRNNILICQRDGYVSVGYFQHHEGFIDLNSVLFDDVIAWRPLPEPYHEL